MLGGTGIAKRHWKKGKVKFACVIAWIGSEYEYQCEEGRVTVELKLP